MLVWAFVLGVVAGMRSMLGPAVASWAAWLGLLPVEGTPLAFMGFRWTPVVFSVLAAGELVGDKLPFIPSRTKLGPFAGRIVTGALTGGTVGAAAQSLTWGIVLGVLGAVAGTLGGAALRSRMAARFGRDLPAALLEDAIALALAAIAVMALR